MTTVGGHRNSVEGVAATSLPAASTSRDIGCVRCVKRLERDPSHKCVKRMGLKRCTFCIRRKARCVPMPRFFWSTARALETDAAAIAVARKPKANELNEVRAFHSRVRGFLKRLKMRGYQSASQPTNEDIPNLLAGLLVQTTRLADYVARIANVPLEAEDEDEDCPDSDDDVYIKEEE